MGGQVGEGRGLWEGVAGEWGMDWRSHRVCGRGNVPSGVEPPGKGRRPHLVHKASGLSRVARAHGGVHLQRGESVGKQKRWRDEVTRTQGQGEGHCGPPTSRVTQTL